MGDLRPDIRSRIVIKIFILFVHIKNPLNYLKGIDIQQKP